MDERLLRDALERRLRDAGYDADQIALSLQQGRPSASVDPGVSACVVLRGFELASFVGEALEFLTRVPPTAWRSWRRALTRTVFLAGDPRRLAGRVRFQHLSADGAVGWISPDDRASGSVARRLLRPLETAREVGLAGEVRAARGDSVAEAAVGEVAVDMDPTGLRLEEYLVHLHHLLAESFSGGLVGPRTPVVLRNRGPLAWIDPGYQYLRVHADPTDPSLLRLFGFLSSRDPAEREDGSS